MFYFKQCICAMFYLLLQEVQRDPEFSLRCKISSSQYQILESVRSKNVERFKAIINRGESPNFRTDTGDTLLHIVVSMGQSKGLTVTPFE